jgi:hypothetical protein
MPKIDDYNQAAALAKGRLSGKDPDQVARFSGAALNRDKEGGTLFSLSFLNQEMRITWPDFRVLSENTGEELPIQQQILLLHYLHGAWFSSGAGPAGEWISFQEVPDGRFYLDAFHRRAKNPLVQSFGEKPELMVKLAKQAYDARPFDQGDASVLVRALPLVPVALILWQGDEEFPPEGNILFDHNIIQILSAEDIAWLAGMIVYPLIGMARQDK